MELGHVALTILVPQMLIYMATEEAAPVGKTSLSMFSTPHSVRFCPPERRQN